MSLVQQNEVLSKALQTVTEEDVKRLEKSIKALPDDERKALNKVTSHLVALYMNDEELALLRKELLGPLYTRCMKGEQVPETELKEQYQKLKGNQCLATCTSHNELAELCLLNTKTISKDSTCLKCPGATRTISQSQGRARWKDVVKILVVLLTFVLLIRDNYNLRAELEAEREVVTTWPETPSYVQLPYVGHGVSAKVVPHCIMNNVCNYVKRVETQSSQNAEDLVEMTNKLAANDITVPIIQHTRKGRSRVEYIMPKMDMTLKQFLSRRSLTTQHIDSLFNKIYDMLEEMWLLGYYHGDIHEGNVMVNVDESDKITKIRLIDFNLGGKLDKLTEEEQQFVKDTDRLSLIATLTPEELSSEQMKELNENRFKVFEISNRINKK